MTDGRLPARGCLDPETLAAFIDGRLEPRERAAVEAHIAECEDCYETWMEAGTLTTLVAHHAPETGQPAVARRWFVWAAGIAAAVTLAAFAGWWWAPQQRLDRGLRALAEAERDVRFTHARLSIDARWRPGPAASRDGSAHSIPRTVERALVDVRDLAEGKPLASAQHALGLVHLAAGRIDTAVTHLSEAVSASGAAPPPAFRSDLAAALIAQYEQDRDLTRVVAALDQVQLVLREVPGDLPALFNRAWAEEIIGPAALAATAWETYLSLDGTSGWADEARRRLGALRKTLSSANGGPSALLSDIERRVLPAWSTAVLDGTETRPDLGSFLAELRAATPDQELIEILEAALRKTNAAVGTVAQAIAARNAWLKHYEIGEMAAALRDAAALREHLSTLSMNPITADARAALVGERNSVFDSMEGLSSRAEAAGYFQTASLVRISFGNTAQRRTQPMLAVDQFEKARALALRAGDRELAATASAMRADAYRNLGDELAAWQALQEAMVDLPAVVNRRLQYSVLRAIADAAVDGGYAGASLDYSNLLVSATRDWSHPGARILAHTRRAEALLTLGDPSGAAVEVEAAQDLLPTVSDQDLRSEYDAEVRLIRGQVLTPAEPDRAVTQLTDALTFFEDRGTTSRRAAVLLARGQAQMKRQLPGEAEKDWAAGASMITDDRIEIRHEQLRISRLSSLWHTFAELISSRLDRPPLALATVEAVRARELLDSLAHTQRIERLQGPALWSWLPSDATALVFAALPGELAVWTVTRDGPTLRRFPIGEAELARLIDKAVPELLTHPGDHARRLSGYLVGSLADRGIGGRLLIVADGPLHRVPMSALLLPDSSLRVVERWTTVFAPSLSVAQQLSTRTAITGGTILLAGDGRPVPRDRLPALPGVSRELKALLAVYPNAKRLEDGNALPETVARLAESATLIHIAGHAVVNRSFPSRSRLVLAPESGTEGLYPSRIAALKLKRRPVVVLSACDTATGRIFKSEGALSLARPFLQAGASAVVAAMRPLNDIAAPEALTDIHSALARGLPVAEALAQWQRRAIKAQVPASLWSTFVVVGGPGEPSFTATMPTPG